jgi:predicted MFS family arabinose efflux permease
MLESRLSHICSMDYLSRLFAGFLIFFIPLYLAGLGFDGLQIGLLVSLISITALFIELPVGIIDDRLDMRYVILLGYISSFVFFFSIGMLSDFWLFIPLFFLGGVGFNIIQKSYKDYVFKDREPWHEGRKFGLYTLSDYLSYFSGAILGMFLVSIFGFSMTLMIIGIYYLVLIPLLFWLEPISITRTRLIQYERDFLHPNNILLAAVLFLFASHWGAEMTSYGLFLKNVLNLNEISMGFYAAFSVLFLGIAALIFGNKIDHRTDFKRLFMAGLLISGLAHVLMTIPDVYISFPFRAIHEVGDGLAAVSLMFWIGRKFKQSRLGGDSGIFYVIMSLGGFTGALIYGPIGFAYGYSVPLIISGITTMICAGLFFILKRRLG